MDSNQIIEDLKQKLKKVTDHFEEELKKVRTGRAHASMLDGINAQAYGVSMPLIQLATITAPEGQLLQITPFDASNIAAISDAIREDQTLGLNPVDDGRVIRIQIPPLSTERRQEIAKQLSSKLEDAMIAARNARHDTLEIAKKAKNDKQLSDDDFMRTQKQIDELMAENKQQIDIMAQTKEKDIMTV